MDLLDMIEDSIAFAENKRNEERELVKKEKESSLDFLSENEVELDENGEAAYEMNEEQARKVTETIKASSTATYVLLAKAKLHKAHKALNYPSWSEYIKCEFEMSPQYSYYLLNLDKVIKEIEAVTPEGTTIKLSEFQAREIKDVLPQLVERIKEETEGKTPVEAREIVEDIVSEVREQKHAEQEAIKEKQNKLEEAKKEGFQEGLEAAADAMLEADRVNEITAYADTDFIEYEVEGQQSENGLGPEDMMSLYNFFNILMSVSSLPEPEHLVRIIPEDRKDEVNNQIFAAVEWINSFKELWDLHEA